MDPANLDVEAVHLVELDLQVGNAAALALAGLQLHQEGPAVLLDAAQLVQLRVVALGDHAAVAHRVGRLRRHRRYQQRNQRRWHVEVGVQFGQQRIVATGQCCP